MVENKGRDSMWQAISTLLSDWHTEAAEIELRNELPGGEIHAAWHLRFGGRDYFVKCDERELLPIFTAEADQLELLSRSKTVSVPQVYAVGSDRDYSFLVMEYLPSPAGRAQRLLTRSAYCASASVERSAAVWSGF
jgi:fructosamine-3-kinase